MSCLRFLITISVQALKSYLYLIMIKRFHRISYRQVKTALSCAQNFRKAPNRHEMENLLYIFHFVQNRSYSPYRHIFARIKVHGIKAMSRGDLVGQTSEKLSIRVIAVEFVYSLKRRRRYQKCKIYSSSFDKFYSTINCYEDISGSYCIKIRFYRL